MKKIISALLIMTFMLSTVAFAAVGGTDIYVSVNGSDITGDGSEAAPFATFKKAKEVVSGMEGATVIFKGGKYRFTEKITFTEADSGTKTSPITYKADDGAEVIFTGAVSLNKDLFTNVSDVKILKMLPESSRSKVLKLDLTNQGLTVSNNNPVLYVNDVQATIARYPNEGYAVSTNTDKTTTFDTEYENVANWSEKSIANAVFLGSITSGYNWHKTTIQSVSGTEITLANTVRKGSYYYVRNLIEELDAPGEYIVKDNILYYYPTDNLENLNMEIVAFEADTMIELNGAEYINFDGITFEKSSSSAINTAGKYTNGITIKNCEFKYLINEVLNIRGYDHVISDNYAYGCGNRFIYFSGGAKEGLKPGNILITRNRIVGCGYWSPASTSGVIKGGIDTWENWICIGNVVSNNIIQDCYASSAINVTGNNNKIMYNEIINMGRIIEDGGAIYSGKTASKYGTEIAYNYIHDFNPKNDYCALYPDDGMSGLYIHHNVAARLSKAMVSGLGANNNFSNNLFIDVSRGMGLGTRMSWDASLYNGKGKLYDEAYGVVYNSNSYIADAYNKQYPEIKEIVDAVIKDGYPFFAPWNTVITGNVLVSDKTKVSVPGYTYENLTTIASTPSHSLKTSIFNGEYYVDGEEELYKAGKIKTKSLNVVDEIATYGDKKANAAGINATAKGNPKLTHSQISFKDELNQDYTITSGAIANSTVNEIDMSKIGIINTTNDKILEEKDSEVNILAVSYDTKKATVAWETVENASEYDIVVTKNSATLKEETCYNGFHTNKYTFDLDGAGTYNITIKARGLSREDMFTVTGEKTFTVNSTYTDNLENALAILKDRITMADEGYTVDNLDVLNTVYETNSAALSGDQNAINNAELAVYEALESVSATAKMEVTRFEADQNSNIVYVEAIGFPANSLATVIVTNPDVTFENAVANATTETIRFIATTSADDFGRVSVSFDTSKNEIDYTGVYKLYVKASDDSAKIEKEYTYGTVEVSAVEMKSADNTVVTEENIASFAGQELTLTVNVKNRTTRDMTPEVYAGIYESGALKNAFTENATKIAANSEGTVTIKVTVPTIYTENTKINLLVWDDLKVLRPLTKTRLIFE